MHWSADPGPFLRRYRTPLSMAIAVSLAMTLVVLAILVLLFVLEAHDSAEALEEGLDGDLDRAAHLISLGEADEIEAGDGVAIRLVERGAPRPLVGEWPVGGERHDEEASSLELAFSSPQDALCGFEPLPDGCVRGACALEGCVALDDFVEDRRQHLARIGAGFALSLVGILLVSVYTARRALSPLRSATAALANIDERQLNARIPVRGTGDEMDRHAEALNRVFARLEESFGRMSAFGADVAHELRTPVNRILNLADVALLRSDPVGREKTLDAVREAAEEMRRLIEDMLLLARGDEGGLAVRLEIVLPGELLGDLAELYRPSCEERGIELVAIGDAHGEKILTDRALLQRALANLIDNAVRHTPRGGRIGLDVRAEAEWLAFDVSDSGPGIPSQERERVFYRFVQLDPARQGGSGLGLPIARMIAHRLGGELAVDDSPQGGACLTLRLPTGDPPGPPALQL